MTIILSGFTDWNKALSNLVYMQSWHVEYKDIVVEIRKIHQLSVDCLLRSVSALKEIPPVVPCKLQ